MDEYMSIAEVCQRLAVSRATLNHWRQRDFGPPSFLLTARRRLYRRTEVERWLLARECGFSTSMQAASAA